jgi:hypothetical protein
MEVMTMNAMKTFTFAVVTRLSLGVGAAIVQQGGIGLSAAGTCDVDTIPPRRAEAITTGEATNLGHGRLTGARLNQVIVTFGRCRKALLSGVTENRGLGHSQFYVNKPGVLPTSFDPTADLRTAVGALLAVLKLYYGPCVVRASAREDDETITFSPWHIGSTLPLLTLQPHGDGYAVVPGRDSDAVLWTGDTPAEAIWRAVEALDTFIPRESAAI